MAVKKAIAKKSVAKKAAGKKAVAKKAPVKKSAVKKSAVKKSAVKKSAFKKSAVKKSAVKKSAVKKSADERFVIPEAPITARTSRVEIVSTPTTPVSPVIVPAQVHSSPPVKKEGASGRVIFAVFVGLIILSLIVWSQANKTKKEGGVKPLPTATSSATPTQSVTPSQSPTASDSPSPLGAHEAPQGVDAHYTSSGATIFWKAPAASDGLTGYNVEISVSNGSWKLISTVSATELSLGVKKNSNTGWTSFRVSSVYSDAIITPAKAFGLPGTYS